MDITSNKLHFDFHLNQQIINYILQIESINLKWNDYLNQGSSFFEKLYTETFETSIIASNEIEGKKIGDEAIKKMLNKDQDGFVDSLEEAKILGYAKSIKHIHITATVEPLSEEYLKNLHKELFNLCANVVTGSYKRKSNHVTANYKEGNHQVVYETTLPEDVSDEIDQLIEWTNAELTRGLVHPLLIIALFSYEILAIHPFQFGNGKISRLMTQFLLLKQGYNFVLHDSFENKVTQNRKKYYNSWLSGQKGKSTNEEKIHEWVLFFLSSLKEMIQDLDEKYTDFKKKNTYLNQRQKSIRTFIEKEQPIKLADLVKEMPRVSINTLKKDLLHLKNKQIIQSMGKNKGTIYSCNSSV